MNLQNPSINNIIILILFVFIICHFLQNNNKQVETHKEINNKSTIIHFPEVERNDWQDRKTRTKNIITSLKLTPGKSKVLDIGGKEYKEYCKKNNLDYTMIDIETPQQTGTGGYNKDVDGLAYDGRNLPFKKKNEFDLVIVNFVFHHASNNTLFLLKQIAKIAKKYVLVGEDLSELDYDMDWHKRNFDHQPGGVFRSDEEWQILFKFFKLKLKKQYIVHRKDDVQKDKIYRCLYLLKK